MKILEIKRFGDFDMPYTGSIWILPNDLSLEDLENEVKSKFGISRLSGYYDEKAIPEEQVTEYLEKLLKRYGATKAKTESITISYD